MFCLWLILFTGFSHFVEEICKSYSSKPTFIFRIFQKSVEIRIFCNFRQRLVLSRRLSVMSYNFTFRARRGSWSTLLITLTLYYWVAARLQVLGTPLTSLLSHSLTSLPSHPLTSLPSHLCEQAQLLRISNKTSFLLLNI